MTRCPDSPPRTTIQSARFRGISTFSQLTAPQRRTQAVAPQNSVAAPATGSVRRRQRRNRSNPFLQRTAPARGLPGRSGGDLAFHAVPVRYRKVRNGDPGREVSLSPCLSGTEPLKHIGSMGKEQENPSSEWRKGGCRGSCAVRRRVPASGFDAVVPWTSSVRHVIVTWPCRARRSCS